jgi:integrase/recombinase XerD
MPNEVPNRAMPFSEWPELDRQGWIQSLQPGDPFEPGGAAAPWADSTKEVTLNGYGRFLNWLSHNGLLDRETPPAARITRGVVIAYYEYLDSCLSPHSVHGKVQQLADALRAIAPENDWSWIARGAARLRATATPVRDKVSRLQSPDRLIESGMRLMSGAVAISRAASVAAAIQYRDGLLIAFLAYRPIRLRNLHSITRGKQLRCENGVWSLAFEANETKTHRRLEFPFPSELVPALQRYLDIHRPVLLTAGGRKTPSTTAALWVTQDGNHLGRAAIRYWVSRRTKTDFGISLSPHLFRDCAATFIATVAPDQINIITSILGHSTIDTAQRHYNQARTIDAGRRYQATIQSLRQRARMTSIQNEDSRGAP